MNPYDWQGDRPEVQVPRPQVGPVLDRLLRGGTAVALAGRGMGKSVLLRQIEAAAAAVDDLRVLRFRTSPRELSYRACLEVLSRRLGVSAEGVLDSGELMERYFQQEGAARRLILLYDEFDSYGRNPVEPPVAHPGRDYFNDLEAMRKDFPVGILATGGIGVFVFRDVLGSSFLSRARQVLLAPFTREEMGRLAGPFADAGRALSEDTLDLLALASGGNPALTTYGLERLWEEESAPIPEIYADFKTEQRQYLLDIQSSFADESLSGAPQRVWELARSAGRPLEHSELRDACRRSGDPLALDFGDVIDLLQAAGLVRLSSSVLSDPVSLLPITSILNLEASPSVSTSFQERFLQDLETLLARLHASSADFFRPGKKAAGKKAAGKQLVPESTFSGVLTIGFQSLGWRVEREAQYGAGRTDLKLGRHESEDLALVEVKIWGRHGYKEVQRQLEGYWSHHVTAGAVVMVTDQKLADWEERYRNTCLEPFEIEATQRECAGPIHARFSCRPLTEADAEARIDHFLLRLARRT